MTTGSIGSLVLWSWLAAAAGCGDNADRSKPADAPPVDDDPTHVTITDGEIRGSMVGTDHQARAFLGIPYAKPPVGGLRWKAPQKPDPWTAPRDATTFSKRCAQLANATLQNAASSDEDCLYLNVWAPLPVPQTALPVMIWIHGGGNVNGSVSEPVPFAPAPAPYFYTGEFLAENHGVVVVSMNYRLGLFGFFAHPDLTAEGSSGNQGLLDQRMAMQWVHDNIAKFGGDPGNVTIFGESAGSLDVCFHVASIGSRGLFHRAISESGGCTTRQRTKAEGEQAATAFATDVGCPSPGALACLRGKSAPDLMASDDVAAGTGFGPDIDGQFLTDQPRALFTAGNIAKVPYLLGSNTDEGTLFTLSALITTPDQYIAQLTTAFGAATAGTISTTVYKIDDFADAKPNPAQAAWARVVGDSRLTCTTYDSAALAAAAGSSVYMYNFDIPAPVNLPPFYLGATHGSELTSVFGTSPTFATDASTKAASDRIQRYWTNFARTGDPNGGSDLAWPKQAAGQNVRLNLGIQATIVNNFREAQCQFWRAGYAAQF
jgi:para-nitrobenzyl esterase